MALTFGVTDFHAQELLKASVGQAVIAVPTELFLGAHLSNPGRAGLFTGEVSTVGTDYAPVDIFSMIATASATGFTYNIQRIIFPTPIDEWGVITHLSISWAASSLMKWVSELREPKFIDETTGPLSFAAGQLNWGFSS